MKKKSLIQILKKEHVGDTVSKRKDGMIVVREGFFYRFGKDVSVLEKKVLTVCEKLGIKVTIVEFGIKVTIVESGEHWAAFRGDASVANSSHWYVVIKEAEECSQEKA